MRRLTILLAAVGALLLVPAAQALAGGIARVNIIGTGSGAVSSVGGAGQFSPEYGNAWEGEPPIECSYTSPGPQTGTCEDEMTFSESFGFEGTFLKATAAPGSAVIGWTRQAGPQIAFCPESKKQAEEQAEGGPYYCLAGEFAEEEVEVTVRIDAVAPLTIAKTGEGTITSNPAGIECTGAKTGAECEGQFKPGSTVELTASPAAGYAFSAWSGCLEHVGLTCKVLMDKAKTVKVTFVATPSLTVEKAGSGYGKVAATGISCDESCSKATAAVKTGTAVTVKVTPAKGNEFASFEGGTGNASSCAATCTFTISGNSSVKVKFSPIPTKTLTVNLTGPGAYKGKVTGKGVTVKGVYSTAIGCGSGCTTETETFFATGETELVAAASTGYAFKGWTVSGGSAGTCTGTTSPCKLLTDANKTVEAEFK